MSFTYTPKSEKKIIEENLIPENTLCDLECFETDDKLSSKGNPMITLKIKVFYGNREFYITDYIVNDMELKLIRACESFGIMEKYDAGTLTHADFLYKSGKAKIGIQVDKSGAFPDKNTIARYVKKDFTQQSVAVPAKVAPDLNDEIPF